MKEYYTYAYLREDRTPYYIGKGKGNRINDYHSKFVKVPPKERRLCLKQNLTEAEAFRHEIYMIAVLGRKDLGTGILINRTFGGDGVSGAVISEETRRKLCEARKGRIYTEETKRKMSEALKGNTRCLGKTFSEEHKAKLSEALKGRTFSEETKAKLSAAHKGKTLSEEHKRKQSAARKGIKWWNDGCGNCKMMIECPGIGWVRGRCAKVS